MIVLALSHNFCISCGSIKILKTIKRNIDCDAEHKNKKVTASERMLWKKLSWCALLCPTRQGVDGRKQTKDEKSDLETKARGDGSCSVITTSSESGQRTCHTHVHNCTRPAPPTSAPALSTRGPLHLCVCVNTCAQ